jgi:class 3 adenylate cyclase
VNAPVAQADPALRAIRLAIDMQAAIQSLVVDWRAKGHAIGFGVGIAMGPAIVGTVGYEGRIDYTAIGNAVNLASRLCGSANDGQILVDAVVAERVKDRIAIESLGVRFIKGYDDPLQVFAVARSNLRELDSQQQKTGRPVAAAGEEVRTSDQDKEGAQS